MYKREPSKQKEMYAKSQLTPKSVDMSKWYTQDSASQIIDYSPVKVVWLCDQMVFGIWENIQNL
jgi:hypothetical protein